ncbi:MBL fold metallo-hydrolase [Lentzea sp. NPDC059081]|uniref:MBL fold metallo-hydrolase n=1 Tax=Lentzea sp. NPDC059081 TaxID=3346719 RepID=UPI0036999863
MGTTGRLGDWSAVRSLRMDDVLLTYVVDGTMDLRPDAFLPDVPERFWTSDAGDLTENGTIAMSTGGLLVERDGHRLLVDAGFGPVVTRSPAGGVDCGALPETLQLLGLRPDRIDVLALTHVHADHTGWAFVTGQDGTPRPTFPSARYLVADAEWASLAAGERPFGAPGVATTIEPLGRWCDRFADGEEIAPGVTAMVTPGHTAGHTSFVITSAAGRRLVAFGDVFHVPAQLAHHDWISPQDFGAGEVLTARARVLAELERPDTYGFGMHFGDQVFGQVARGSSGEPEWRPLPTTVVGPSPRGSSGR